MVDRISRRDFVALAATGAAAAPLSLSAGAGAADLTAQEVVDQIRNGVGVEWKADTVDSFKAGDPATIIKGMVTTALPTIEVLRRSVNTGANLIITSGPTFYSKGETAAPPAGRGAAPASDPVFAAKADFIRKHNLVVWRLHDHWRLRRPDPFAQGLTEMLGWSPSRNTDDPARLSIPGTTLEALAAHIKKTLNAAGGIRVIGDPRIPVQNVGMLPGSTAIQASLGLLPAVDVIIAGEVREWEAIEYARDAVTAGQKKGLILLGRVVSEDPGMRLCAEWLKTVAPAIPATWIPAGDPYWRPF